MPDSVGTFERIAAELAKLFRPLETRLASGNVRDFLAELGLALPPELLAQAGFTNAIAAAGTSAAALPPLVAVLVKAIEDGDTTHSVNLAENILAQISTLLNSIDAIGTQLNAIGGALPGVPAATLSAFAAALPARMVDFLVVSYFEGFMPGIARTLALPGLMEIDPQPGTPGDPTHPAFVRKSLRLDRIGQALTAPDTLVRDVYGWGTGAPNILLLMQRLHDLLFALSVPALFDIPAAPGLPEMQVFWFKLRPTEGVNPPGLRLVMDSSLPTGASITLPFFAPGWSVGATLRAQLAAATEILLQPPANVTVTPPSGQLNGGVDFQLIGAPIPPKTVFPLLGQSDGTRIEAGKVSAGLIVNFKWDSAANKAKGDLGFEFKIEKGKIVISLAGADGFLASVLPAGGFQIPFDFLVGWTGERGLFFGGGAALETSIPIHAQFGPIAVDSAHLVLGATAGALNLDLGVTGSIELGPLTASVQDIGARIRLEFHRGNLGPLDLSFKFKPPTGLGIAIDAGLVTGGGFIQFDEPNARYAGILQLRAAGIGITAIGLLDTRLPGGQSGYSFLIIVAVNLPPIQLGFGFTLTGIGGLAGINRTVITDAIVQGLRNGILDHIMFPPDPIKNAPQIISDLRTVFPPAADRYVFGPMLQLAWGTPSLIVGQLGVILEVPDPIRLILIGQLKMELPAHEAALVEIHIDLLGVLDFGQKLLMFVASMHDSRVTIYSVYGDMAFRLYWGDPPNFAYSMGGWNPHFTPPPGMPELRRLTVALGLGDNPRFTCQSYFAVTSNSFQFGARMEAYAEAAGFNIHGWIGFDALVIFSPFSFIVDISAGVELRRGTSVIAGIHLDGHLAGPNPWHAWGEAGISFLFFDISVGFDVTIGDKKPETLPTADPWPILEAAIKKPDSWNATIPTTGARVVTLAIPGGATPPLLVDPLGGMELHQKVLPLNRKITKFGEAKPSGPDHYNVTDVHVGTAPSAYGTVKDYFASGQFQELADADKLSRPSFELMDAGVSVGSSAAAHGGSIGIDVVYETIIVDAPDVTRFAAVYQLTLATQMSMIERSESAKSPLWKTGMEKYKPGPGKPKAFKPAEAGFAVASSVDMSARFDIAQALTMGEAHDALDGYLATHPEEHGSLYVIPMHELEAAV